MSFTVEQCKKLAEMGLNQTLTKDDWYWHIASYAEVVTKRNMLEKGVWIHPNDKEYNNKNKFYKIPRLKDLMAFAVEKGISCSVRTDGHVTTYGLQPKKYHIDSDPCRGIYKMLMHEIKLKVRMVTVGEMRANQGFASYDKWFDYFPNGFEVTTENWQHALDHGLDVLWMSHLLKVEAHEKYMTLCSSVNCEHDKAANIISAKADASRRTLLFDVLQEG